MLNGGAGDDVVKVNSTYAFSTFRGSDIFANGGEAALGGEHTNDITSTPGGFDRLHLDGKVGTGYFSTAPLTGTGTAITQQSITMTAMATISVLNDLFPVSALFNELYISTHDINSYTDTLKGKTKVDVNVAELNNNSVNFDSYKDYVVSDYNANTPIVVNGGAGTIFTNLRIEGEQVNVGSIDAPYLNILIDAENSDSNAAGSITVNEGANIIGRNIILNAENSDEHRLELIENDLSADEDDYSLNGSMFDVVSDVKIDILSGASLRASECVAIEATSSQTSPLIPVLSSILHDQELQNALNFNFVSVKVGSAIVTILGSIYASTITVNASNEVELESTNENLALFGIPLAIGVIIGEAGVVVTGNAVLNASNGSITIKSNATVDFEAEARSGLLPFTLAVSTVVNDSYVDIGGSARLIASKTNDTDSSGDVNVQAKASTHVVTNSTGYDYDANIQIGRVNTGNSGGFFAVSVVVQNCHAAVVNNASVNAAGDFNLGSMAFEYVTNKATSNPEETGGSFALANLINKITDLLTKAKQNLSGSAVTSPGSVQYSSRTERGFVTILSKLIGSTSGAAATGPAAQRSTGTGVTSLFNQGTKGGSTTSGATGSGIEAGADDEESSSTQLVGALAVTYAQNSNKAYINTLGDIIIEGTLNLRALGSITDMTLADGSPIVRTSRAARGVAANTSSPALTGAGIKDTTYNVGSVYNISFDTMKNGFVTVNGSIPSSSITTRGAAGTTGTAVIASGTSITLRITALTG